MPPNEIENIACSIGQCFDCVLGDTRTNTVPGEGGCKRGVVFIGEAPGRKEDETGRPFVGTSGKLLDSMLGAAGLSRNDVFITSVLKCRPPDNRDPKPGEKEACSQWMEAQLEELKPRVIAPLGRHGLGFVSDRYGMELGTISSEHGNVYKVQEKWGEVIIMPLFHPAALIYRRVLLPEGEEDMKKLASLL